MSESDDKFRVEFQLPASWHRGIADTWKLVSGPAVGALGALQQKTFLWQLNNAAEILARVKKITDDHQVQLGPVTPKFLIPFLEKAGLEHDGGDNLRDLWARLLVNESVSPKALNLVFLDILSSITAAEVRLIEFLAKAYQVNPDGSIVEDLPGSDLSEIAMKERFNQLVDAYISGDSFFDFEGSFISLIGGRKPNSVFKGLPTLLCVPAQGPKQKFFGAMTGTYSVAWRFRDSIIVLMRMGVLMQRTVYSDAVASEIKHRLEWVELSDLGIKFFNACSSLPIANHKAGNND